MPTSRSRTSRSASSALPEARRARALRSATGFWISTRFCAEGLLSGIEAQALGRVEAERFLVDRCGTTACVAEASIRIALRRGVVVDARETGPHTPRERRLRGPSALRDWRLHRLLRRHPARDQRRAAAAPGQSADAELQIHPGRLSRSRVIRASVRNGRRAVPRPSSERTAQAGHRGGPERSVLAATSITSSNWEFGSGTATRSASRYRLARPQRISPASAC